jgi:hypothetical protein
MWEGRADSVPDDVGGVSPVIVEHAPGASRVSVRAWDGMHPVLLRCCCSADAAVGGGELCPSADVGGVSPVARQLWAGASPVPSQISASGKVPAGKVRAAALAPACNTGEPSPGPQVGCDTPSLVADLSGGEPNPVADWGIGVHGYQRERSGLLNSRHHASRVHRWRSLLRPYSMRRGVRSRCRCEWGEPRPGAGCRTDAPSRAAEHGRGRADQP